MKGKQRMTSDNYHVEAEGAKEERTRYMNGLKRYQNKGIPIYMDGKLSNAADWERLFELREDNMFYMGDYVQAETGELKEIRFDKVYCR